MWILAVPGDPGVGSGGPDADSRGGVAGLDGRSVMWGSRYYCRKYRPCGYEGHVEWSRVLHSPCKHRSRGGQVTSSIAARLLPRSTCRGPECAGQTGECGTPAGLTRGPGRSQSAIRVNSAQTGRRRGALAAWAQSLYDRRPGDGATMYVFVLPVGCARLQWATTSPGRPCRCDAFVSRPCSSGSSWHGLLLAFGHLPVAPSLTLAVLMFDRTASAVDGDDDDRLPAPSSGQPVPCRDGEPRGSMLWLANRRRTMAAWA